jgi:hypothetical protein
MKMLTGKATALVALLIAFGAASTGSAAAADEFDKFALESVSASLSTTQAGAHADFTTAFKLTQTSEGYPYALTRDVELALPQGIIGNPQAIPRCTVGQLGNLPEESECPRDSQVGISEVTVTEIVNTTYVEPVYNMTSPGGDVVARLGLYAGFPIFIDLRIDPIDYSLVATIEGASSAAGLLRAKTTIWGVPAAHSHDDERMTPEEAAAGKTPPLREAGLPEKPFYSNPTDCSLQRQLTVTARSYQEPDRRSTMSAPFPQITGCGKLSFSPSFTAVATNPEAAAPTGLDAELEIPQDETPQGLATSTLRSATVALPEGIAINPAAADGLASCSADQVGFGRSEPSHCPDAAKVGSVELEVPALDHTLHGGLYQRTPENGELFRLWLVTDEQGVHLKLPGEIQANPLTGQLTTVFAGLPALGGNPQLPFSDLRLHVFGGPRAPLATPSSCGTYHTHYQFTPWSGKPPSEGDAALQVTAGCGKGGFAPDLAAGMRSLRAGSFSPFAFTLTRSDGEANPRTIALHLPQGLLAKLRGVPLCPDSAAATGACPAGSKVGAVTAATGVGGAPLWVPQPGRSPTAVYLAGPYRGAPYSVVAVVPAQAGPFDLGTVVNRSAIEIDPETALATISTDPLPQILQGVPLSYRTIHVEVDRPKFMLNPTGCNEKRIRASVTASNGATAEPRVGFQATNCAKLKYAPKLSLRLKGGTKRGDTPALKAVLTQKSGEANIAGAVVTLPHSEFLEQAHIRTICTRVRFAAKRCPAGSIYGHATAITPLLDGPLSGPVYLRSSNHQLPDLVVALKGPDSAPIEIDLVGRIDSVHGGIRSTFSSVPDAPVSKFTLEMQGGKKGLIVNSRNLCSSVNRAQVKFTGQNGTSRQLRPVVRPDCKKSGRHKRGR